MTFLILDWWIMQLDDVEQLVGNPVGSGETAAPAGEVGLLDAPGLGRSILRADEQTVLAGSDDGDVVPVEAVAAERVDDLDVLVSDLQPWVEPESPRVEQRQHVSTTNSAGSQSVLSFR